MAAQIARFEKRIWTLAKIKRTLAVLLLPLLEAFDQPNRAFSRLAARRPRREERIVA